MGSLLTDLQPDDGDLAEALGSAPTSYRSFVETGANEIAGGAQDIIKGFGQGRGRLIPADEANRDFGVDGHLTFERPTYENTAAAKQHAAQRKAFHEDVMARSELGPLAKIGAALHGALLDPLGLPLIFLPEIMGLRGVLEAGVGLRAATGASVVAKAGRLANAGRYGLVGVGEGAASGAIYEAGRYAVGAAQFTDEDFGESLNNILLGTVLGGALGGVLGGVFAHKPPKIHAEAPEETRLAAAMLAMDDVTGDRPVSVAAAIEREGPRAPPPEAVRGLDDVAAGEPIAARHLEDSVAVTSRGREIPVRYALVELGDLVTSHTDDLERNPAFPAALQPRDRSRAGSQAGNYRLEAALNPKRLMREPGAETGAPLVAADGTVESGNGRTIALRRSSRTGSPAYDRYRAELDAQGFDTTGMDKPVLVRIRSGAMSGEDRAGLAREMNAAPTEAMGPSEQAMADAASLDDALLSHLDGTPAGERAFMQAFVRKVAPDQQNAFADAEGRLSQQGRQRVAAALVARAYDDPRLIEAVFETADPNIRTLGTALSDAAPAWAKLRSLVARGEIPAGLDVTAQLRAAVDMIRHARDNKIPVDEWIADRLEAVDMFTGQGVDHETETLLRLFFRDDGFKRHRSADRIAWALKDYARQAGDVAPGPNLFGDTPDGEARLILDGLAARFARDDAFPAGPDLYDLKPADPPLPVRIDLRPDAGGGGGEGLQPARGGSPAQGVAEAAPKRPDPLNLIDPELKALAEQDLAPGAVAPRDDPAVIAEAVRAAAFCLREGGV